VKNIKYRLNGVVFLADDLAVIEAMAANDMKMTAEQLAIAHYNDALNGYDRAKKKLWSLQQRLREASAPIQLKRVSGIGRGHKTEYRLTGGKRSLKSFQRKIRKMRKENAK